MSKGPIYLSVHQHTAATTGVVDPVCGMTVDPASAAGQVEYRGHTYYFCCQHCVEKFKANPERFLAPVQEDHATPPAAPDAEYTCPMHPEVRQQGPGSCPICGMALEPVTVTLDEQPNHELEDMTRRFRVSLVLTAPILAFMVAGMIPALSSAMPRAALNWIELVAGVAGCAVGRLAFLRAWLGVGRAAAA